MTLSHIERLGYFFHPSAYDQALGHAAVDVYLSCNEQDWFFATETATFQVLDDTGTGRLHITCSWSSGKTGYRLAPGRFFLVARDGDLEEGFTFGGDLSISEEADLLTCQLNSTAPFFDLTGTNGLAAIIVPEFEAELARLRAEWTGSDEQFDLRVANVAPDALFAASLLQSDYYVRRLPAAESDDMILDERLAVNHAIHVLKQAGDWQGRPPSLQRLILGDQRL